MLRYLAALEFQHFFPRQIKCPGNYTKKYILPRLVGFYIKNFDIYLANLSKNNDEK